MDYLLPMTMKSYVMLNRLEDDQDKRVYEKTRRRVVGKNLIYSKFARRVVQTL
jgi:hypothetical protein